MTDSSSFSSLLELVDSHLSKTLIQESRSEDANNRIQKPSLTAQPGSLSDTRLLFSPGQRLPLPSYNLSGSPIQSILAEQVANMLKVKELKRQQEGEKERLAEDMRKMKLEEEYDLIDLLPAVQSKEDIAKARQLNQQNSISSSLESLFEPKFIDCDYVPAVSKSPEPLLPCMTDMSYILSQKVMKGKCSAFGKVLTSRVRPVAAPYLKERIKPGIVQFDFKTMSPCDCIKEKLRRPTVNCSYMPDIFNMV